MYYYFFPLISRTGIFPLKQSWTHRRPPLPSPPGRGAGSSPPPSSARNSAFLEAQQFANSSVEQGRCGQPSPEEGTCRESSSPLTNTALPSPARVLLVPHLRGGL